MQMVAYKQNERRAITLEMYEMAKETIFVAVVTVTLGPQ